MIFDKLLKRTRDWTFILFCIVSAIAFVCRYILASYLTAFSQVSKIKIKSEELIKRNAKSELKESKDSASYKSLRYLFNSEYDRENPVTSEQATKDYFKWMVRKAKLTRANCLVHGYALPNRVYENLQSDLEIQKDSLDKLDLLTALFQKQVANKSINQQPNGAIPDISLSGLFNKIQEGDRETSKQKFQRVVSKHFLTVSLSPFSRLLRMIESLFKLKNSMLATKENQP